MRQRPYLLAFIWVLIVTALSVMPQVSLPKFDLFSVDKLGHTGAYAIMAWLMFRGFRKATGRVALWKEVVVIFCLCAGYGALMELIQGAFFPARFFEVDDMIANAFGAALAIPFRKL